MSDLPQWGAVAYLRVRVSRSGLEAFEPCEACTPIDKQGNDVPDAPVYYIRRDLLATLADTVVEFKEFKAWQRLSPPQ